MKKRSAAPAAILVLLTIISGCNPATSGRARIASPTGVDGLVLVAPQAPPKRVDFLAPSLRHGAAVAASRRPLPPGRGDGAWQVIQDETLRQTLRRWGRRAGVAVFWETCDAPAHCLDWQNQVSAVFQGSFDDALVWVLEGHGEAEPRPVAVRGANRTVRILADGVVRSGGDGS